MGRNRPGALIIIGLTLIAICAIALVPPIPQNIAYHNFADHRVLLGIPNFLNVASNLCFAAVGILGTVFLFRNRRRSMSYKRNLPAYVTFFTGVGLTSLGSAYYHLSPGNERLMWDRLPMSIAFMALCAAVVAERTKLKSGLALLFPLLALGLGSVVYWQIGEINGNGDLRLYVLVQFYSMLVVVLCALVFPSEYSHRRWLFLAVGFYAAAKILELLDRQVFMLGGIVSGHTLKHIVAAASAYSILLMLRRRKLLAGEVQSIAA
jgi:hypothetical protein